MQTDVANAIPQPEDLGPEIARYPGREWELADLWRLFLPGAAAILAPLAYGLWRADTAYRQYGSTAAETWSRPWFYLAGLGTIVFLLLLALRRWQSRKFVTLHPNGLAIFQPLGRVKRLFWKELAGVTVCNERENFLGVPWRLRFTASLIPHTGKLVRLDPVIQNQPELVEKIKENLYPERMAEMQAGFQDGRWLNFGPLEIHLNGLRLADVHSKDLNGPETGREPLPWRRVERLEVKTGFLVVELDTGKQHSVPISQIPNFELLIQLIDQAETT